MQIERLRDTDIAQHADAGVKPFLVIEPSASFPVEFDRLDWVAKAAVDRAEVGDQDSLFPRRERLRRVAELPIDLKRAVFLPDALIERR